MPKTFDEIRRLSFEEPYPCPVCRRGQLNGMVMMDAFACSFCRHIFTASLEQQILRLADSPSPLVWVWTGAVWQGKSQLETSLGWGLGFAIALFILLPTTLVGCGAYYFPPLPGSRLAWLPLVWVFLTFLLHGLCIGWLLLEYYQIPVVLYCQALGDNLFNRSQLPQSD
jgi:hypothetical protein